MQFANNTATVVVVDINLEKLQQFVQQGYGNIVNMASLAGLKAYPNNISYGVSKFAVVAMTKSAALEYADYNI